MIQDNIFTWNVKACREGLTGLRRYIMVLNLLMSAIDVTCHSAQRCESFLACWRRSMDACEDTRLVVVSWHNT